jgi:hypothetical protein
MFKVSRLCPLVPSVLAGIVVLGTSVQTAWGDDFDPRDLQQEVMVRQALAKDPRLQPLNLIVRVKDRVATLSGPVPSRELAQRALATAKKVPEFREIRDNMLVQFEDSGLLLPLPVATKALTTPGMPEPSVPTAPALVIDAKKNQTQAVGMWVPVGPEPAPRHAPDSAVLPATSPQTGVTEAVSRSRDTASTVPTAMPKSPPMGAAVQNLILGEDRFRKMRYELKENKVYLSGAVRRWADLEDLAKAVMRIPGVEGVVLSSVKTDSPR